MTSPCSHAPVALRIKYSNYKRHTHWDAGKAAMRASYVNAAPCSPRPSSASCRECDIIASRHQCRMPPDARCRASSELAHTLSSPQQGVNTFAKRSASYGRASRLRTSCSRSAEQHAQRGNCAVLPAATVGGKVCLVSGQRVMASHPARLL